MRGKWSHSQRNGGKALLERGYLWGKEKGGGKEMTFDDQRDILHFVLILLVTQVHAHKVTKHEGVLWIRGKEPHNTKASTDTIKEYKVGGYLRDIAHVEPRDVTTYKQTCKTHTYSLSIPPSFLLSWTRFVEFLTSRSSTFSGSGFIALHHSQRETELKQPYRTIPYRTVQDLRTQDSGLLLHFDFEVLRICIWEKNRQLALKSWNIPITFLGDVLCCSRCLSNINNTEHYVSPPPQ